MRTLKIAVAMTAAVLALPAVAAAHVTLQPNEAPAGGFTRLNVRVPNEEDDQNTTKVDVKVPPGFAFVSYEAVPGWKVEVKKTKLAKPIKTDDGTVTEQVSEIVFTGDGRTGAIEPGQFRDFGLSVGVPDRKPGTKLTFPAVQTYSKGTVVRWIGPPDSDHPAPQVTLTEPAKDHAAGSHAKGESKAGAGDSGDDDGPSTGLVIVALVLGAAGLGAGGLALARGRAGTA